jgi:hypothetical protein
LAGIVAFVVYAAATKWTKQPAGAASASNASPLLATAPNVPTPLAPTAPSTPPSPAAPLPETPGPRIRFASQVYDFGKANGDSLVDCVFVFTNAGNQVLEITSVSPGCSCMKAGEWSRKVEPGQTGTIPVQYDSHHYTGYFAKSVFVTCNDANQPQVTLEIKGTVWRPIEITPPSAVLNLSAESPSNAAAVRIISHLDEPLILSDLTATLSASAFAVELQTNQPGKEFQVNVKTLPPWPTSSQQGQITLKSSATNMPLIGIPFRINVQPVVMAIPFQVRLPPLPLSNAFSSTVWIRNNGTNRLALAEPVVNAKGVEATVKEEQPGQPPSVTLNFPAGFDVAPVENIELRVNTGHPQFPVVRVPIIQPPRPGPVATRAAGQNTPPATAPAAGP